MQHALSRFYKEESGSLLVNEWVFVASILVLLLLSSALTLRHHVPTDGARISVDGLTAR